jgi:hypothetical protein
MLGVSYWCLNEMQAGALKSIVTGLIVHDLGAGDLSLAEHLIDFGALHVVAIDKEPLPRMHSSRITYSRGYFEQYYDPIDVAVVSWPPTYCIGLPSLVKRARVVVYIGKNTDGTACGSSELFGHLLTRELSVYLPDRHNTLICYGNPTSEIRKPQGEELAAISCCRAAPVLHFEEVEGCL